MTGDRPGAERELEIHSGFHLGYRPALDGVRAIAVLAVLVFHTPRLSLSGGFLGVDIFFVLSGFLITSILVEEWNRFSRISLKAFYARRVLRLLPALVVMLLAAVGFSAAWEPPALQAGMRKAAVIALFYSANWFKVYDAFPHREISHTWSLSVEEQFYVVWPILLLTILRARWSRAACTGALVLAILASAGLRAYFWAESQNMQRAYFGSDSRADGLLVGALAALLASWGCVPKSRGGIVLLNLSGLACLALCGSLFVNAWTGAPYLYYGGFLVLNVFVGALLLSLVVAPWNGLRTVLESAPAVGIGRISYALYLWHVPVFWMAKLLGWGGGILHQLGALAATFVIAVLSYYCIERPILRLKERFTVMR